MDQMRSYTINKGMMDSWVKLFETGIKPAHEAMGIPVVATWVNACLLYTSPSPRD